MIDIRFLSPRATCAHCGRAVDPEGATVIEEVGELEVDCSLHGTHLHADITPAALIVICGDCATG